jgi:seryl-tRNA synthetase
LHDIKWIRDNPEAFDRALARRGLKGEAQRLSELDERPPRRDSKGGGGTRAPQRCLAARSARRRRATREETAQKLLAEVARLKEELPKLEATSKVASDALDKALAEIPNLPLAEVPDGADETAMSSTIISGPSATTASIPSSTSIWAKGSARWISRPPRSFRARALSCSRKGLARLERALGSSCSIAYERARLHRSAPPLLVRDE